MNIPKLETRHYQVLLKQYTQWLSIENYQPNTITAYHDALSEFFQFLERNRVMHLTQIEQGHLSSFKQYLLNRRNKKLSHTGIQNITINSIIKGVNCFAQHINTNHDRTHLDIYEGYLPVDTHEKVILTQDEIMRLYHATFESRRGGCIPMGQRDRVMIAVFYGCGLRLNEGRNLNLSDIDIQNKRLLVRHGKGKKERYVPIANKHLADIITYIQQGRDWFRYHHYSSTVTKRPIKKSISAYDEQALFLTIFGTRMKTFYHCLDHLQERAGLTQTIGTHTLRHSIATHLLQKGWKIEQVSTFLGHASIDSTQIYAHIVESQKTTTHEQ